MFVFPHQVCLLVCGTRYKVYGRNKDRSRDVKALLLKGVQEWKSGEKVLLLTFSYPWREEKETFFVEKTLKSNDMGLTAELLGSNIIFFVVKNVQQKLCKMLLFKISKRDGFLMYLKCAYPRELYPWLWEFICCYSVR